MKLLVFGGTGLLGGSAVEVALQRGHAVTVVARSVKAVPQGVQFEPGDVSTLNEAQLRELCTGHDAVIYALGLDDRNAHRRPALQVFLEDHVTVCSRVARAARDAGVTRFAAYGSYFTHFERTRPQLELAKHHPYITSRCAQRDALLALAAPDFRVFVLELPYIIGSRADNVPPWTFIFSMLAGPIALFFATGGTAAVTARQVGQAAIGAVEGEAPSGAYALGGVNWTWAEWARRFLAAIGKQRRVFTLSRWAFAFFGGLSSLALALVGKERGLAVGRFSYLHYSDAFVDPEPAQRALNYGPDDYDAAFATLVKHWLKS